MCIFGVIVASGNSKRKIAMKHRMSLTEIIWINYYKNHILYRYMQNLKVLEIQTRFVHFILYTWAFYYLVLNQNQDLSKDLEKWQKCTEYISKQESNVLLRAEYETSTTCSGKKATIQLGSNTTTLHITRNMHTNILQKISPCIRTELNIGLLLVCFSYLLLRLLRMRACSYGCSHYDI